ncbi:uncharacterized protein LOC121053785 [Oryza brachyantha]|uniref:uncharacterized protein LOC121053785 n=1 Tax=Oryza brachyantha TaxID=4533 RepID=UPI001ADB5AAB|nr:uncharacterized protein LOC121053785 [Oryza brachyantha]
MQPTFRRSIETISRYFKEVLYAVGELRNEMIKPPPTETNLKISSNGRFNPYFKDCIGAIDGTHVLARVPAAMSTAFRGRKKETTQNVMAAVDFGLRFTYVLAGWEGSAHDALILADALERDDGLSVLAGKYYLVDAGYAARPGFLPPYRGTRYHLKEFDSRNYPRNSRELFNLRHSSLRVTIERAFGALKNRFKILYSKPFHPYKTQVKLVLACCILHNWILQFGNDQHVPLEAEWRANDRDEDVLGDIEEDNRGMAQIRDDIATDMWNNRGMAEAGSGNGGQAEGVRTDKGFKEVHLNQVARSLSDHYGLNISGTQVYNHLRKWRQRWVRITRLKDISGALWDDQNSTIVLEDEHYMGHVKDHPKDAEFLNVPLENYTQMTAIFSNGQATGKYAMGSNEALGKLADMAESDLGPLDGTIGDGIAGGRGSSSDRKRKRTHAVNEGEAALITNMTESVREVAAAIRATAHTEVHPELSDSMLNLPGFTEDQLELVLTYLTNNKATSLVYIQKNEERRARWVKKYLEEHLPDDVI